jgi:hypothetical protein
MPTRIMNGARFHLQTYTAEQKGPDALGEQRGVNQDFKGKSFVV